MGKVFRPSSRESTILSKIESTKEHLRRLAISKAYECAEPLANSISMSLIEKDLIETTDDKDRQMFQKFLFERMWPLMYGPTIESPQILAHFS